MKLQSVQGYLLATAFLNIYKEQNEMTLKLKLIHTFLMQLSQQYVKKGINVNKQLDTIWKKFTDITNGVEEEISCLTFVFNLILKNPNRNKFKALTDLTRETHTNLFSKEETEIRARKIVNSFYGIGNDNK